MNLHPLKPHDVLQKYWGFESFRPLQEEIIQSVLDGKDTLALLPTGGGKSICYQLPALCLQGVCLVVSPLIALMQDQVLKLKSLGIEAAAIHSGMKSREIDNVLSNAKYGNLKLLYLSPERLASNHFLTVLEDVSLSLVAIDEAHCIAQWGYDFRPSYLKIAALREYTNVAFLALTATATPYAKEEIISQLKMVKPALFETSFRRKQLSFIVKEDEQKKAELLHIIAKQKESIILYARNRRITVELTELLQRQHYAVNFYHAGLSYAEREIRQQEWIDNKLQVIVATNAFGMGIDKPDVRMVVHLDLPQCIEEYYQEAGRAGRDQKRAYAVLLYNRQDCNRLMKQWNEMFPEIQEIRECYKFLAIYFDIATGSIMEESRDFDLVEFSQRFKLSAEKILHMLKILEQRNYIFMTDAVVVPSRIQILASVSELSTYRNQDVALDEIIQALLRMYEGIFNLPVPIHEKALSRMTGIELNTVYKIFKYLQFENVIRYQEAKSKPQLQFINERLPSEQIQIDITWYKKRKKLLKDRIQKFLDFLETKECRQNYISRYFGQMEKDPCGICDNCLNTKFAKSDKSTLAQWKAIIREYLEQHDSVLYRDLLKIFPSNKRHWVEEIIQQMLADNEITRNQELLMLNVKPGRRS